MIRSVIMAMGNADGKVMVINLIVEVEGVLEDKIA